MFVFVRIVRRIRRERQLGVGLLLTILALSIVGNALAFYFFDRGLQPGLTIGDAFWYSVISITTIGYGDFSAESLGARIGTVVFIAIIGLTVFSSAIGIGVDWILEQQYKERTGMGNFSFNDHLLIINFPSEMRVRQIIQEFFQDPVHNNTEVVLLTDQIETNPLAMPNVSFVRGSPMEEDAYMRANAIHAKQAIILSTGYDDPHSDSHVASIVSILEHVNPEIRSVAEVLNENHSLLFKSAKNVSLVYTISMSNNLMVQEIQDPGVNMLTRAITSNLIEGTLSSTSVESDVTGSPLYKELAKKLLDHDVNLMGVIRGDNVHVQFDSLSLSRDDRVVYISMARHDWPTLKAFLEQ